MRLKKAEDMTQDEYYAEQDELFNTPIETTEEYCYRVAQMAGQSQTSRVFSDFRALHRSESERHNRLAAERGASKLEHTAPSSSMGKSIKRKASEPQVDTAEKRRKYPDQNDSSNTGLRLTRKSPCHAKDNIEQGESRIHDMPASPSRNDLRTASPSADYQLNIPASTSGQEAHSSRLHWPLQELPTMDEQSSSFEAKGGEIADLRCSPPRHDASDEEVDRSVHNVQDYAATTLPRRSSHERSHVSDDAVDEIDSFTINNGTPAVHREHKRLKAVKQPQPTAEFSPIGTFSKVGDRSKVQQKPQIPRPQPKLPLNFRPVTQVQDLLSKKNSALRLQQDRSDSPIESNSQAEVVLLDVERHQNPPKKKGSAPPAQGRISGRISQQVASRLSVKVLPQPLKTKDKAGSSQPAANTAADEPEVIYISSSPSSRASSPASGRSETPNTTTKASTQAKPSKRKSKAQKETYKPMLPAEFAKMLMAQTAAENVSTESKMNEGSSSKPPPRRKKSSTVKFLAGKNIFYTGGDMKNASEATRKRMSLIVKYGGNLQPVFDPKVTTHIITTAASTGSTLRALGLKTLKEIPDHIPTLKWTWMLAVLGKETVLTQDEIERKLRETWDYAAIDERMDAGYVPQKTVSIADFKGKGKARAKTIEMDPAPDPPEKSIASVSALTLLSPPASPERHAGQSKQRDASRSDYSDPLAQFYTAARSEKLKDDGWSSPGEFDDESDDGHDELEKITEVPKPKKRGWTCDQKPETITDCPNQDIIDKLTELMELHKAKVGDGEQWRVYSYSKCIRVLKSYPHRIKTYEQARLIKGVGEKTAKKIEEILQTGDLRRIAHERTEDVKVGGLFQGIYGVGRATAAQWFAAGCRTLEDLRAGKCGVKLSTAQQIGLRYYEDINTRMPRDEAKAIFDLIKPIALSLDSKLFVEIMGSYRRGKKTCGDIDVLITRPTDDGKTHSGILPRLLHALHKANILTEDLAIPDELEDLEAVYRGLCKLPGVPTAKRRRIDFLCVPWTSRGAAMIYYTGDDIFNRAMRLKANVMGYSLNQRGLFGNVIRDPTDKRIKLNDGVLIASETEEEIFKILEVPWQEPHERVRG